MNFALRQFHGWSISELEAMMPFERDVYIMLLTNHLEEQIRKQQQQGR